MKFSIRDLLLLMVIMALMLGWGIDRSRLARQLATWKDAAHTLVDFARSLNYTVIIRDDGTGLAIGK